MFTERSIDPGYSITPPHTSPLRWGVVKLKGVSWCNGQIARVLVPTLRKRSSVEKLYFVIREMFNDMPL